MKAISTVELAIYLVPLVAVSGLVAYGLAREARAGAANLLSYVLISAAVVTVLAAKAIARLGFTNVWPVVAVMAQLLAILGALSYRKSDATEVGPSPASSRRRGAYTLLNVLGAAAVISVALLVGWFATTVGPASRLTALETAVLALLPVTVIAISYRAYTCRRR